MLPTSPFINCSVLIEKNPPAGDGAEKEMCRTIFFLKEKVENVKF